MTELEEKLRTILPPLFSHDDIHECNKRERVYCESDFTLYPTKNDSIAWKLIEQSKFYKSVFQFKHPTRGFCLERKSNDLSYYSRLSQNLIQNEIENLGLKSKLDTINCKMIYNQTLTTYDYLLLYIFRALSSYTTLGFLFYFIFLIYSTCSSVNKFLKCFSILENFEALKENSRGLKFIESLRGIVMIQVVIAHSFIFTVSSFVSNPEYLNWPEKLSDLNHPIFYIVQYFFVLSGWFLTYNMCNIYDKNKTVNIIDVTKIIFNRFLRFYPSIIIALLIATSNWIPFLLEDKPFRRFAKLLISNCQENWMATIFLYNNENIKDACFIHMWFVSVDLKLYIFFTITLYVILNFKINFKVISGVLVFGFLVHVLWIYFSLKSFGVDYGAMSTQEKFYSYYTEVTYYSAISNVWTFIVGMYFGWHYYYYKNQPILDCNAKKGIWLITTLASIFGILSMNFNGDGIFRSILIVIAKPIHGFGWAFFLLGLSQHNLKRFQSILEWKYLRYIANFNFATYIFHYPVLLIKYMSLETYHEITIPKIIIIVVQDCILSFTTGLLCYLLFDKPFQNILKTYGPQIKKQNNPKYSK